MPLGFDAWTLLTGLMVFAARASDVTIGTVRTICIVHGRIRMAFALGLVEISIWLVVISVVLDKIKEKPILGLFYALGFASGNVVGIMLERRLAIGNIILRIITPGDGHEMADAIRKQGFGVTIFRGEGKDGPVAELYIVCRRRDQRLITSLAKQTDPDAFWVSEMAGDVNKVRRPFMAPRTGWRGIGKRK